MVKEGNSILKVWLEVDLEKWMSWMENVYS